MNNQIYVSDGELARRFNVSRQSIWRWARMNPKFPKPRKLSNGTTRWFLPEIEAWEQYRAAAIMSALNMGIPR